MSTDNRNELDKKIADTIAVLQQAAREFAPVASPTAWARKTWC